MRRSSLAVLPIHGTLVHRTGGMDAMSGLLSYARISDMLQSALGDPSIEGILLDVDSCEGMLVRNPQDTAEWGIFYNGKANPERQRFTIAHELGHFILHRDQRQSFNCDKESVYSGEIGRAHV